MIDEMPSDRAVVRYLVRLNDLGMISKEVLQKPDMATNLLECAKHSKATSTTSADLIGSHLEPKSLYCWMYLLGDLETFAMRHLVEMLEDF
jgi:hypothetical protein